MAGKILFVDDDAKILQIIRRALNGAFDIDVANSGEAALRKLQSAGRYAVIVSDIQMPGMSGIELLSRVKAEWPEIVRLVLTSETGSWTAADATAYGDVFRLLSKPFDLDKLEEALFAALKQHQQQQSTDRRQSAG